MTDRELMQMALDAIETIPEDIEGYLPESITDAVIALRARLAQPEPEPVACVVGKWLDRSEENLRTCIDVDLPLWTKLYTAPPQREWKE